MVKKTFNQCRMEIEKSPILQHSEDLKFILCYYRNYIDNNLLHELMNASYRQHTKDSLYQIIKNRVRNIPLLPIEEGPPRRMANPFITQLPVRFGKQYMRLTNDLKKIKTKRDATKMWYRVNRFGQKIEAEFGNDEESGWFASRVVHPIRNWLCVQAKNRWDWCPKEDDWGWFVHEDGVEDEYLKMAFGLWGKKKVSETEITNGLEPLSPTDEQMEKLFENHPELKQILKEMNNPLYGIPKPSKLYATPEYKRLGIKYSVNPMFVPSDQRNSLNPIRVEFGKIVKAIQNTKRSEKRKIKNLEKRISKFGNDLTLLIKDKPKSGFEKFIEYLVYIFTLKFLFPEKKYQSYPVGHEYNPVGNYLYSREVEEMNKKPVIRRPSNRVRDYTL